MSVTERFNLKVGDFQLLESPVEKHGTHDQKTHGNWATGVSSDVASTIQQFTREWGGLSINLHGRWVDAYYWVHGRQAIFFRQGSR
jgi:hypothetical protein